MSSTDKSFTPLKTPAPLTDFMEQDKIRSIVRETYGDVARNGNSCCEGSSAGCGMGAPIDAVTLGYSATDLQAVPEGSELGLGCGNPIAIASIKPGEVVVDLGSGGGFDCFLAAERTGSSGHVIGVDMTPDMISKARANAAKAGVGHVEFRLGEIENLPIADGVADLIISNCVINLSPNKARVFQEAYRALKPGGRLAISDIVATAPIPDDLGRDFAAYCGCVSGAALVSDLEQQLRTAGFADVRITVNEASRRFIDEWFPGRNAGRYVVSAAIEAVKPGVAPR